MTSTMAVEKLQEAFPEGVTGTARFRDESTVCVEPGALRSVCEHLHGRMGFNYLVDISSLDHFGEEPRFEMVYEFYSMRDGIHLRVKSKVDDDTCTVPTVSDLWPTADWHEREVYDMMGIRFDGHPDLRRILMWEGFPYHPLRKDFPLAGKHSDAPGVAFSEPAPLAGGPFVSVATDGGTLAREPRARPAMDDETPRQSLPRP
jgi:NADH-quinone oxidoreductase subunit C